MTDDDLALEMLQAIMNGQEAGIAAARQILKERKGLVENKRQMAAKEEIFTILKFEDQQGAKIGSYQVAYEKNNAPENFSIAHSILVKSNAVIDARYYGEGYEFTYWVYGEGKIYRQKHVQSTRK